jgi:hypothetical protein
MMKKAMKGPGPKRTLGASKREYRVNISTGKKTEVVPGREKYNASQDATSVTKTKRVVRPIEQPKGKMLMKKTMSSSTREGISEAAQQKVNMALKKKPVSKK